MQLEGRLEARGSRIRGLHLAEILASRETAPTVDVAGNGGDA